MDSLGAVIKEHRQKKKMTLVELGKAVSLSHGYLSNIENDNKIPTPEVLKKLSDALECDYPLLLVKAGLLPQEAEEAIEMLNMIWANKGQTYKLVIEEDSTGAVIDLEDFLKKDVDIILEHKTLTAHQKEQLLKIAKILTETPKKE